MRLEPLESAAFAIHQNKGAYALLLGSGMSRSARIPTGWEIVLDLIERLAQLKGDNAQPDAAAWYRERYGEPPEYDKLVEEFARTQDERSALLRGYIEPSREDRENNLKVPQAGHRAVAQLVANGFVKVTITTNFDPLIEQAIEEAGVVPDVLSTADQIKGARPMHQARCVVLKVNGDYRDIRIRNTEKELSEYEPELDRHLDSLLDEHGLLVCGWSADYDVALCAALHRSPSRRYTAYWTRFGQLSEEANRVAHQRGAITIPIKDADSFFVELADKVEAIDAVGEPHPLSVEGAVAATKTFIAEERHRVRLEDMVATEVERTKDYVRGPEFPLHPPDFSTAFGEQLRRYEAATEILCHIAATVGWYDQGENAHLLTRALERLAETTRVQGPFYRPLEQLRQYPALRVLYATGISALAAVRAHVLRAVLLDPVALHEEERVPLLTLMATPGVLMKEALAKLDAEKFGKRHTPSSEYMQASLRNAVRSLIPSEERYQGAFDLFEYVLGLVYLDVAQRDRAPVGRFGWRRESRVWIDGFVSQVREEGDAIASVKGRRVVPRGDVCALLPDPRGLIW